MFTLAVHAARAAHERDEHRFFSGELRSPNPPTGWENGETRFPHPLLEGEALPRAGVWGNLVPHVHVSACGT